MIRAVALAAAMALVALPAAGGARSSDYAAVALNVLPPGQSGDLLFPPTGTDQLKLYDGLTPRAGDVRPADLTRYFKPERFGVSGKVVRTERPRPGLRILRDRWDVPHVYGRTRTDVEFGAGYATAEDRFILLELLRGPGRLAALDVPGLDPFALATSGRQFVPTAETETRVAEQLKLVRGAGSKGLQLYADVRTYVAGINAYYKKRNQGLRPWTMTDVIAVGSLLGADLGVGGGDETRRSLFLDALRRRVGLERAPVLWDWLAQRQDATAPVSVDGQFSYDPGPALQSGNVVLQDGSFEPSGTSPTAFHFENPVAASNALLVGARRSATRSASAASRSHLPMHGSGGALRSHAARGSGRSELVDGESGCRDISRCGRPRYHRCVTAWRSQRDRVATRGSRRLDPARMVLSPSRGRPGSHGGQPRESLLLIGRSEWKAAAQRLEKDCKP
jgi:hypothetical protein